MLLAISVFPAIPIFFAGLLGIESPANFVFLFMIFLAFAKLFTTAVELSVQKHRINSLVQRLGINETMKNDKK